MLNRIFQTFAVILCLSLLSACGGGDSDTPSSADTGGGEHMHEDGSTHADHEDEDDHDDHDDHEETTLGTYDIEGIEVEAAQGHGGVEPGEESHLVIKLPYSDNGQTSVRAWIGTEDRTLSRVGRGEYAPSHDDYDIHAVAPDPLPEDAAWWVEIEKPDGTIAVGSFPYLTD